jgi:hypothetical protein
MAEHAPKPYRSIHIEIHITPRTLLGFLAIVLLAGIAAPLFSEDLTLTTIYPSPLGVYKSLISTGGDDEDTVLVRDGGKLGVGTDKPNEKLHVEGNARVSGGRLLLGRVDGFDIGLLDKAGLWSYRAASDFTELFVGGKARLRVTDQGRVGIGKNDPAVTLDVNGPIQASGSGGNVAHSCRNQIGVSNAATFSQKVNCFKNEFAAGGACWFVPANNGMWISGSHPSGVGAGGLSGAWTCEYGGTPTKGVPRFMAMATCCQM